MNVSTKLIEIVVVVVQYWSLREMKKFWVLLVFRGNIFGRDYALRLVDFRILEYLRVS